MSNQKRAIRLFHRHINFNSTSAKRKSCMQSLRHSLRISPVAESVKQLEWNLELEDHNLLYRGGKLYNLKHLNDDQKWKVLLDIAPKPKIKNHTKHQTQHRQYRKKLKDAAKAERKRGNELAAECLERIVSEKGMIKRTHIQDIHQVGFSRYKQRIGAIKRYVLAHNKLCNYPPSANNTVVQEGIFKIPHRWNVTSDDISLKDYVLTTKRFLDIYFPDHPIKAIVGHDDERNENEKTGLHTHYFLSGKNLKTGKYDLRKRQIIVVNEFLFKKGLKDQLLPINKDLTRQQSRALGHYWQCLVQDFINVQLLNSRNLHAEFTDETEKKTEQYQYMICQSKLPKSERDFNHYTRLIDNLSLEIQALKNERVGETKQFDAITQQVNELSECLKDKNAELERLRVQKNQYQQELEEAAHRYLYLEEHSDKKENELAYTESLLAEKEVQLAQIDAQSKRQMQEIVRDAFMLMIAKRKKYPRAEREYTEKIAERLGGDIPSQLVPLLDAVLEESGYSRLKMETFEY
ncbi:TPA: hypothetical protein NG605_004318 [Vibrio parahaemolyticus]|nr:hypothetical protein [Vibrio parahaemolyticus]